VKEQAVESVGNAEGGTKASFGKLANEWTSRAGVAMESKTSWEVHEAFGSSAGMEAVTYSEEAGAHERMNPSSQGHGGRPNGISPGVLETRAPSGRGLTQ